MTVKTNSTVPENNAMHQQFLDHQDDDIHYLTTLMSDAGQPSISIILATSPGPILMDSDRGRLEAHTNTAVKRVITEWGIRKARLLSDGISHALSVTDSIQPTEGLAVMVNTKRSDVVTLRHRPIERLVVDPTFATRDLHYDHIYHPTYRVLVASSGGFRILEGHDRNLADVRIPGPEGPRCLPAGRAKYHQDHRSKGRPDRSATQAKAGRSTLSAVIDTLRLLPSRPLVVIAPSRIRGKLSGQQLNADPLIDTIDANYLHATPRIIANFVTPAVMSWLGESTGHQLDRLNRAGRSGRLVYGIHASWRAALTGRARHLWVAADYRPYGTVDPNGVDIHSAAVRDAPNVIDDLADDLIEVVCLMGGNATQLPADAFPSGYYPIAAMVERGSVQRIQRTVS